MFAFIQKAPFLIELLFNGMFILFYSLRSWGKLPRSWDPAIVNNGLEFASWLIPIILFMVVVINYLNSKDIEEFIRKYSFSFFVFVPLLITWGDLEFCFWLSSAHLLSSMLALYDGDNVKTSRYEIRATSFVFLRLSPAQIVLFSFALTILAGAFLLMLPVSAMDPNKLVSFIDALFMSASATCVTGLATINPGEELSVFGQMILLILAQIGGLGIMTLTASMGLFMGKSMDVKERIVMQDLLESSSTQELFDLIVSIVKYTFIIEAWGGIILTVGFYLEGFDLGPALYHGFYHSIMAFCNAGLSSFSNNLESYATAPIINITVAFLIILGGIGFIVLREMNEVFARKRRIRRLTLHTKMVLTVSSFLLFAGTAFIFFGEYMHALDGYTVWEQFQISFFQSVTTRTAGFDTIPMGNLNSYTLYVMIILMFMGASPGSTGGGIKTTTVGILTQTIKSLLWGGRKVEAFDRSISPEAVIKAIALTICSIAIVALFILILMKTEPDQSFLAIVYECTSAFGTVGLSMGITPFLTMAGKLAITLLMYVGRVGPLTLVLAVGQRSTSRGLYERPEGKIIIG